MANLFCFGLSYTAEHYILACGERLDRIAGTVRDAARADRISRDGLGGRKVAAIAFDGATAVPDITRELAATDFLLVSIPPDDDGDPVLRHYAQTLVGAPRLAAIVYLSTIGVYGDHDGAWIDETTTPAPVTGRSRARLDAEQAWQRLATRMGKPLTILRLAGIYGPGRNTFRNLEEGTAKRLIKPDQVFNRIRVEDIAGATALLIEKNEGGIFNITDNEPAPPQDLVSLAAEMMGVEPPPEVDFENAELTPMARSFYGENKRVSNAKLRSAGYELRFADYRASLSDLWQRGVWRG